MFVLLAFLLVTAVPLVVPHPAPLLDVDLRVFLTPQTGCTESAGWIRCDPDRKVGALGCEMLMREPLLGGLSPRLPVVECRSRKQLPEGKYLRRVGGLMPEYVRLLAREGNSFVLIRNAEELRARFAPVDTPEEALAFAVAATGWDELHGWEPPANYRYYVSRIEETHVTKDDAGYVVRNLTTARIFGCGPHPNYLASAEVSRDGVVTPLPLVRAWENPKMDALCVD